MRVRGRTIPAAGALLAAVVLGLPSGGAAGSVSGGPSAGAKTSPSAPATTGRSAACDDSRLAVVDKATERRARNAVLCLVNAIRKRNNRPAVSGPVGLAAVGQQLAADLADYDYLRHADRQGRGLTERLRRAGYGPRGTKTFKAGETLAYGFGRQATPKALVDTLLTDRIHKLVLLGAVFREAGIGVVAGTPDPDYTDGATLAIIFLRR